MDIHIKHCFGTKHHFHRDKFMKIGPVESHFHFLSIQTIKTRSYMVKMRVYMKFYPPPRSARRREWEFFIFRLSFFVFVVVVWVFILVKSNLGLRTETHRHDPGAARPCAREDPPPPNWPKTPEDAFFASFLCILFWHHFLMPLQDVLRALQDGPTRPKTAPKRPKSRPRADFGGFLRPKSIQVGTRYASQSHLMLK